MVEALGWIGSILFSLAALSQAVSSWKQGHSDGLTWGLLILWFLGEIMTALYVALTSVSIPLLANYLINFSFLLVIIKFKMWPRSDNVNSHS